MRRIVLTYGLIGGAIVSLMMAAALVFQEQIGFDRGEIVGYTSMVVAFLMVFVGVKTYRDTVAGGSVTFGRALQVGLLITAVTVGCYVASWQVVYYGFAPDFMERYAAHTLDKARAAGASEEEIAQREREMTEFAEWYRNPLVNIAFTAIEPLPVGLVFTLVSAGVLSRKRS
jgi:hypothetical protein